MPKKLKFAWSVLVNELSLVSERKGIGGDTLLKCILMIAFSACFYFFVYHYDAWAVKFDFWLHDKFGWQLSTPPSERKVEWHRMIASGMALVGIVSAVGEYSICLWRRIQKRRLQGLSRDIQMNT